MTAGKQTSWYPHPSMEQNKHTARLPGNWALGLDLLHYGTLSTTASITEIRTGRPVGIKLGQFQNLTVCAFLNVYRLAFKSSSKSAKRNRAPCLEARSCMYDSSPYWCTKSSLTFPHTICEKFSLKNQMSTPTNWEIHQLICMFLNQIGRLVNVAFTIKDLSSGTTSLSKQEFRVAEVLLNTTY